MRKPLVVFATLFVLSVMSVATSIAQTTPTPVVAIKAGRLIDPETGTAATGQVILIEGEKIKAVGANLAIPAGATVIDLSKLTVLPGLVDAHTHMAITYKEQPENNYYYLTYVMESSPLRAIQAASNGIQLLSSGFTVIRDVGQQCVLRGHRPAPGNRAGLAARADRDPFRADHRQHRRTALAHAGNV